MEEDGRLKGFHPASAQPRPYDDGRNRLRRIVGTGQRGWVEWPLAGVRPPAYASSLDGMVLCVRPLSPKFLRIAGIS